MIGQPTIIASHGNSVLFMARPPKRKHTYYGHEFSVSDNFLYEAGGSARLPSLLLLPSWPFPRQFENEGSSDPACRSLEKKDTGLLWRGDDEFLVV